MKYTYRAAFAFLLALALGAIPCAVAEVTLEEFLINEMQKNPWIVKESPVKDWETCGDYLYTVEPDGSARIRFYDYYDSGAVEIPAELDGRPVTAISRDAFVRKPITSVTIPESVTSIDEGAFFGCTNIKSIRIPDGVTHIGEGAFSDCGLKRIEVSKDHEYFAVIRGGLYEKSTRKLLCMPVGLKENVIDIPEGTLCIGANAFAGCYGVFTVNIPDSVTSIGEFAFSDCWYLLEITIPESVEHIGVGAFMGCEELYKIDIAEGNSHFSIVDGALCDKETETLMYLPRQTFDDPYTIPLGDTYVIPNGIKTIGRLAFSDCNFLKSITIPDSVTHIGDDSFGFTSISQITIPENVTDIGASAFENCARLETVTISDGVKSIGETAFARCRSLTAVSIPDSVTTIGGFAFSWCDSLKEITIPQSVTSIGENLFYGCEGVTVTVYEGSYAEEYMKNDGSVEYNVIRNHESDEEITCGDYVYTVGADGSAHIKYYNHDYNADDIRTLSIPDTLDGRPVTVIGDYAFLSRIYTNEIIIPEGVTSIGSHAFGACSNLKSIRIPDSVKSLGDGAFSNCSELRRIEVSKNSKYFAVIQGALYEKAARKLICLPRGLEKKSFEIPEGTLAIGDLAMAYNSDINSVTIPDSVKSIGEYAFSYCSSLEKINIPSGVENIGYGAFMDCEKLSEITVSEYNKRFSVKDGALIDNDLKALIFLPCGAAIKSFVIPDGIQTIGPAAFRSNHELKSVVIPDGVTDIGERAFNLCESLEDISIPASVKRIGDCAFSGCVKLSEVKLSNGLEAIDDSAFMFCESLKDIEIPDSVTDIGGSAFYGCVSLESVAISKNVTSIGQYAFMACDNLTINVDKDSYANEILKRDISAMGKLSRNGEEIVKCGDYSYSVEPDGSARIRAYKSREKGFLNIPDTLDARPVTAIGDSAFAANGLITGVSIPEGVTDIGAYAFSFCYDIKSVTIPSSVSSIGSAAFVYCESLRGFDISKDHKYFAVIKGALYEKAERKLICVPASFKEEKLVIPEGTRVLGAYSVNGLFEAKEVTLPDSLTAIEEGNFSNCYSLEAVTIPKRVASIGESVFTECFALSDINVSPENQYFEVIDGALYDKVGKKLIILPIGLYPTKFDIAQGTLAIGDDAFSGNEETLEKVTIPDSVTTIGDYAFYGCSFLKEIVIPNGVTTIGDYAFAYCDSLASVVIPASVTSMGSKIFEIYKTPVVTVDAGSYAEEYLRNKYPEITLHVNRV